MSMDFIVSEDIQEFNIKGSVFKYKPATAGDEIEWFNDYTEIVTEKIVDPETGKEKSVQYSKSDNAKLSLCKLRNIVEVPFTQEEVKNICGINKSFKDFDNKEKDIFFKKFKGEIFNKLISNIEKGSESKKELPT